MRMPEFTPAGPELWFNIIDRGFQAAGITVDVIKFGYTLTAIDLRYTGEVCDHYEPARGARARNA